MIFASSYLGNLLLLILALVCLGSWINTLKLASPFRFEFYGYDFAVGVALAGVLAAFTFGSMATQELTFQDDLLLTSYRKMAWAMGAGVVFALANLLTLSGVTVSGISVAFPLSLGLGFSISTLWDFSRTGQGNLTLLGAGVAMLLIAIVAGMLSASWYTEDEGVKAQKAFIADPRTKAAKKRQSQAPGLVLSIVGGIFMGVYAAMTAESTSGENRVASYSFIVLFSLGVLGSSIVFVPFFMNFPVLGQPLQLRQYFKAGPRQHLLALTGGMILGIGVLLPMVAAGATATSQVPPALAYGLSNAFPVLAALFGILLWGEGKGASTRVRMARAAMLILFLSGIGLIAVGRIAG